jgi:hypothetical protein
MCRDGDDESAFERMFKHAASAAPLLEDKSTSQRDAAFVDNLSSQIEAHLHVLSSKKSDVM